MRSSVARLPVCAYVLLWTVCGHLCNSRQSNNNDELTSELERLLAIPGDNIQVTQLAEASTQKSAKTHTGNVFCYT